MKRCLTFFIMAICGCVSAQTETAKIHTTVYQKVESCPCQPPTVNHSVMTYWVSSPFGEFLEWKEYSWEAPTQPECYDVELHYTLAGNLELWAKRPSAIGIIRTGGMPNGNQADEPLPANSGYQLMIRSRSCPDTGVVAMPLDYSSNVNGIKPLPQPGDVPVLSWAGKWEFQTPGAEIGALATAVEITIPDDFLGNVVYLIGSGTIETINCRPGKSIILRSNDNSYTITIAASVGRIGPDKTLNHRSDLLGVLCSDNGVLLQYFSDNG